MLYTHALVIAIVYTLLRFIETKYVSKEDITLKQLVKDAMYSYLAAICGIYVVENVLSSELVTKENIKVFTNEPDF